MCKADSCRPFVCVAGVVLRTMYVMGMMVAGRWGGAMVRCLGSVGGATVAIRGFVIFTFLNSGVSNYWNLMRCTRETSDLD